MATALLLVGCGKMGSALLSGWIARGIEANAITVVEPHDLSAEKARRHRGITVVSKPSMIAKDARFDVVCFAVKPQMMPELTPAYAVWADRQPIFLSIAAGIKIDAIERALGDHVPVVRAMPNTPAAIGHGITAACANSRVNAEQRTLCTDLLAAVGEVVWIDDEALMDVVTAVSGSGPAYVFLLAECLAAAGVEAGLPAHLAARLAEVTVAGAGRLLALAEDPPEVLRRNVTSPGGTTAAALEVLMAEPGLRGIMNDAVQAAVVRSRELGT